MKNTNAKLQLVLRSRKLLVRVDDVKDSFMTWDGRMRTQRRRIKVYDYVLDDGQERALREAKELAGKSGLDLVVVDVTRQSALRRALNVVLRN
ncbi:MAG TPA: hypothetical protein VLY65_02170 [Nitrososphaerales archaeon]|nr:hypothetical protein [Nitrososphaerales archaeon]